MVDEEFLKEVLEDITSTAIAKGMPNKQFPIMIILAIISTLVQVYMACKKEKVASLFARANERPHGLAAMRVRHSLFQAFPIELHVDAVMKEFIAMADAKLSNPTVMERI